MAVKGRAEEGAEAGGKAGECDPPTPGDQAGEPRCQAARAKGTDSGHGPGFTGAIGKLESEVSVEQERERWRGDGGRLQTLATDNAGKIFYPEEKSRWQQEGRMEKEKAFLFKMMGDRE